MNVYRINADLYAAEFLGEATDSAYEVWSKRVQLAAENEYDRLVAAAEEDADVPPVDVDNTRDRFEREILVSTKLIGFLQNL